MNETVQGASIGFGLEILLLQTNCLKASAYYVSQ